MIQDGLASSELAPEQKSRYRPVPTTEVVGMDESPVEAIRGKPRSSISVMCDLAKRGEADVVISAGNTGACVAAAQLKMRTLPGVSRPGIAVVLPKIQVCHERSTWAGEGMMPSATQCSSTAKCHSATSSAGSTTSHGARSRWSAIA